MPVKNVRVNHGCGPFQKTGNSIFNSRFSKFQNGEFRRYGHFQSLFISRSSKFPPSNSHELKKNAHQFCTALCRLSNISSGTHFNSKATSIFKVLATQRDRAVYVHRAAPGTVVQVTRCFFHVPEYFIIVDTYSLDGKSICRTVRSPNSHEYLGKNGRVAALSTFNAPRFKGRVSIAVRRQKRSSFCIAIYRR